MPDEEFDMLGEGDLTLVSWFERMYTNQKNAQRSSGIATGVGGMGTS
jgi:hypothetical protein